jgi:energy-coupling factor transporter ATP-binding protein EcfA2
MYIKSLRINNYKSFLNSGEIFFEKGFNLIVGQNDSGKSALLQSLQPGIEAKPHRSLLNAPEINSLSLPDSVSVVLYSLSGSEVSKYLGRFPNFGFRCKNGNAEDGANAIESFIEDGCELRITWTNRQLSSSNLINDFKGDNSPILYFSNLNFPNRFQLGPQIGSANGLFADLIANQLSENIYAFDAERYAMGSCAAGGNRVLRSDASNLPEVLNKLTEDRAAEDELLEHVRSVFPHITNITSTLDNNIATIRIWTNPIESRRLDLAVPLKDSGSGIGQVLAMLYVVVTANSPKIILIDEPQSFLHPGAVRKLFEIFSSYPQHQYIITTHAPTGLNVGDATNMLLVKRGVNESTVTRLDPTTQQGANAFLSEVGARMSDVFGADNVLWVEGKTEENCFPILIREVAKTKLHGTQILGVVNTGDIEAGFADRIIQIYQKLSEGPSVLPPALAFIFDSEGKSETERADISRRAKDLVKWLPRRMYENYLIEADEISEFINLIDATRSVQLTSIDVKNWLIQHGSDKQFFPKQSKPLAYGTPEWFENVHAAKILQTMFSQLTEQRYQYDKIKHGEQLTRMISKNPSDGISSLAKFIASCCNLNRKLA